jgi:hypothetical protein
MSEYKLIVDDNGARILDRAGRAIKEETALTLLDQLHEHYERPTCVYFVHSTVMDAYKIGWTGQRIEARVSQIRYAMGNWQGVELEYTVPCQSSKEAR